PADVLLSAARRGVDSHGVARLSGYVRLWEQGRINATPNIRVVHETPTTATVDGDKGLGLVVAPQAMEIALAKARQYGSGWVAIRNSHHFGIAAYHALKAVAQDMRSEEHTSELQSRENLVCRLLLEKHKK